MAAKDSLGGQFMFHFTDRPVDEFADPSQNPWLHVGTVEQARTVEQKRREYRESQGRTLDGQTHRIDVSDIPVHDKVFSDGAVNTAQVYRYRELGLEPSGAVVQSHKRAIEQDDYNPRDHIDIINALASGRAVRYHNEGEGGGESMVVPTGSIVRQLRA